MISLGHLMKDSIKLGKMDVKLGQVVSNPYAKAFAPIKEGEDSYFNSDKEVNTEDGPDHEVSMAMSSLESIMKAADELKQKLAIGGTEKDIPAWIQDHITNSENFINQAAKGYYEYNDG